MSEKIYSHFLKIGVFASFLSFFLIDKKLLFPYVTIKQIYFNILIEILLIAWLALVIKYPAVRPKFSWLTGSLAVFFLLLLISGIFGVDFNLSFWGDAERMLGWFHIAHFFVLYLIIITVFRTKNDWFRLFNVSIGAAVVLTLYSFLVKGSAGIGNVNMASNISTLGNATYVAGVMMFNIFFCLWFIISEKTWVKRLPYLGALGIIMAEFFYADVSGSQAGLAAGLLVGAIVYALVNKNKKIRILILSGLAVFVVIIGLLFAFRDNQIFDNTKTGKIFRDFSLKNTTLNTRFYSWRAGIKGFEERPVLGSGYGNYALFFDKYFTGDFYKWTKTEEYYDRAHNNLIDIACTGGVFALLAYLGIFCAIGYYLIKAWRRHSAEALDLAIFGGIFTGYFIHNLAVFDALANYILLMVSLGYVYWLLKGEKEDSAGDRKIGWINQEILVWLVAGILALIVIYQYNIKTFQVFYNSVDSLSALRAKDCGEFYNKLQKTFSLNTPLDRDARSFVADSFVGSLASIQDCQPEAKKKIFDYLISLNRRNTAFNQLDNKMQYQLAVTQSVAGNFLGDKTYLNEALTSIDAAIANGGQHIPPYFLKAELLLSLGREDEAVAVIKKTIDFYPDYYGSYCFLARIGLEHGSNGESQIYNNLDNCLRETNLNLLKPLGIGQYLTRVITHYSDNKNFPALIRLYEYIVSVIPNNQNVLVQLIDVYKKTGDTVGAKSAADRLIKLMPEQKEAILNLLSQ